MVPSSREQTTKTHLRPSTNIASGAAFPGWQCDGNAICYSMPAGSFGRNVPAASHECNSENIVLVNSKFNKQLRCAYRIPLLQKSCHLCSDGQFMSILVV